MTDHSSRRGRIDLRAIDDAHGAILEDRIIERVLASIAEPVAPPPTDVWSVLSSFTRPVLAAAAVLLIVAVSVIAMTDRGAGEGGSRYASVFESWTASRHVPTNGELLATFQGYGQ